jgi:hypothetical protein
MGLAHKLFYILMNYTRPHTVVQLVDALAYKLECHKFDSRWGHWELALT